VGVRKPLPRAYDSAAHPTVNSDNNGYMAVLPISKELPIEHNIEKAAASVITGNVDIRGA
jgi:hypothetical protein